MIEYFLHSMCAVCIIAQGDEFQPPSTVLIKGVCELCGKETSVMQWVVERHVYYGLESPAKCQIRDSGYTIVCR